MAMSIRDKIKSFFTIESSKGSNDFNVKSAPNSTGNTFETIENIKAATAAAHMQTGQYWNELAGATDAAIDMEIYNYLGTRSLNDWFLLQLQANYYANTIRFNCSNPLYFMEIKKVIRAAFLYGKASLYYDKLLNRWYAVMVSKANDHYEIYKIRDFDDQFDMKRYNWDYRVKYADINDIVTFHWGVNNQSAIVYHYPFVRLQNQVLKQMTISSLVLSKKLLYKSAAPNPSTSEIKNWLNPFKFVLNVFQGKKDAGKFEWVENQGSTNVVNEIDYYNKLISVWYDLFGRRVNTDVKKERNVSGEVDATQENFDVLQAVYIDCFKAFIKELQLHPHGKILGELEWL